MIHRTSKPWTESELQQLKALVLEGLEYKEIARLMPGRTPRALRAKADRINMTPEQKAKALVNARKRYATRRVQWLSVAPMENVVVPVVVPGFVLNDLARRLSIVPTFDNLMTGTPLPTCSALDRPAGLYYAR